MKHKLIALALMLTQAPAAFADNAAATADLYDRMVNREEGPNVAFLNLFMTKMPKGGDLHHHYPGTLYAETFLEWMEERGWLINPCDLTILLPNETPPSPECAGITVGALVADGERYRRLLMLWSNKDFSNHFHLQPPPDSNFFNTFHYFGRISGEDNRTGLAIVKERAVSENVSYVETMLERVGVQTTMFFDGATATGFNERLRAADSQEAVDAVAGEIVRALEGNADFSAAVSLFLDRLERDHEGIDDQRFTMRYQTYAVRVLPPLQVFLDLYAGFLATHESLSERGGLLVGVNIVAPEHDAVALADYTLHMRFFNYLSRSVSAEVGRALHAGELTLGMVRPKDLLFHIWEARRIAGAQRIGHGVDVVYEADSLGLLADLKANAAVEINLRSNEFILGVAGSEHPYSVYAEFGVPMVICTDDSGVSRNNLSNEFVLLASRYRPSYAEVKGLVYNSVRFSFLDEGRKAVLTADLHARFADFEREMAAFGD